MVATAISELKKHGSIKETQIRALGLGPSAKGSWLELNPFDQYWVLWLGTPVFLTPTRNARSAVG
jgi:hypothetical protein